MAKTPEQYANKITEYINELTGLGWTQTTLAARLEIGQSTLSRMKREGKGENIDSIVSLLGVMVNQAELPGEIRKPLEVTIVGKTAPDALAGGSVLDYLRHADKLMDELEITLSNAERICLPLLQPGLKQALEEARRLHKSLRIG